MSQKRVHLIYTAVRVWNHACFDFIIEMGRKCKMLLKLYSTGFDSVLERVFWGQLYRRDTVTTAFDTSSFAYLCSSKFFFFLQYHHMSLIDFVVSPLGCGRSVTDFWGWDAHEAQLRRPYEVDGDIWIWSTNLSLNLNSTKLPGPWSPWESSPSRKNPHGWTGNQTRDLMISS
jgi:hypothetical protein